MNKKTKGKTEVKTYATGPTFKDQFRPAVSRFNKKIGLINNSLLPGSISDYQQEDR